MAALHRPYVGPSRLRQMGRVIEKPLSRPPKTGAKRNRDVPVRNRFGQASGRPSPAPSPLPRDFRTIQDWSKDRPDLAMVA